VQFDAQNLLHLFSAAQTGKVRWFYQNPFKRGLAMSFPQTRLVASRDGTCIAFDVYGEGSGKPALIYITGAKSPQGVVPVAERLAQAIPGAC
jgi:hypothetical protein